MEYNLMNEPWLPAIFGDGRTEWIRPWEIVGDDPPVALNPQRPDFRAALMEFLVGLLQTAFAPESMKARDELLKNPPDRETLRSAFTAHAPYFNLFGERPRFMQDLTMSDADKPVRNGVGALLIEQPGAITLRENKDLFIKRGQLKTLCPACAAAALHTLQAFAPSGGRGNRTSMRGGGPLSTLAVGKTLWESLWLNVSPSKGEPNFKAAPGDDELKTRVYPWMSPTRTSDKNEQVHPDDMHPLHAFWGMPRRIVLRETDATAPCDICGRTHPVAVREFLSRPNGYNYGPEWVHPLTPYTIEEGKPPLSIKGRSNIEAYGNWLGVVYGEPDGKRFMRPARCVRNARRQSRKVNVAGYDMDNAKAREWCEHLFPIIPVEGDTAAFSRDVNNMVTAADQVRRILVGTLKDALVNEAGKNQAKIDSDLFKNTGNRFWSETEAAFYECAAKLAALPDNDEDLAERDALRLAWGGRLLRAAKTLFEDAAGRIGIPPERMKRYVDARSQLIAFTIKKLRDMEMHPQKEIQ
ncbi:type I-E CRISPR-associated protein Cse1/CasA [Desulfovibrio sp. Fe33]|uniref:type I-E CRISPR-associated protein Cse1/CasA n=1 Tax=Desulfovibrio sp. Fe33 TaxID=3020842 RepID=UPI00234D56E5|nr:type I-E CRISPR-associated protein Cse1/CasA [Desulfovibrio sp. Fe33]